MNHLGIFHKECVAMPLLICTWNPFSDHELTISQDHPEAEGDSFKGGGFEFDFTKKILIFLISSLTLYIRNKLKECLPNEGVG